MDLQTSKSNEAFAENASCIECAPEQSLPNGVGGNLSSSDCAKSSAACSTMLLIPLARRLVFPVCLRAEHSHCAQATPLWMCVSSCGKQIVTANCWAKADLYPQIHKQSSVS